ncbi:MAG: hypothetical protein HKN32_05370, partial [Flavobacteriales bacterium]|nr:hypothetical protein [Flavobacteriales bacterium]
MQTRSFRLYFLLSITAMLAFSSCKKDDPIDQGTEPSLIFRFAFDPNQERLDNLGQPSEIGEGNAAQSPSFNSISAHYLELSEDMWTQLGEGELLYEGPQTNAGGADAIDFSESSVVAEGENFLSVPLSNVNNGTYEWLRVSLSYQNFDITYLSDFGQLEGTLAGFIGFNTYIEDFVINEESVDVFENKLQGFWGFETVGLT